MSKQRILGDLAHNLDSSAVGSFLAKSSAGGDFKKVSYSLVSGTPSALDSSLSQAIIDSSYIQARQTATGTAGLDSATMLALIDSSYISGIHGTNTGFDQYYYNATAGQTIFDSDLRGRNLSYEENGVMVFLNGVMLAPSQYTATDGSTVVLDSAASLSDEVTVVKFALGSSGGGGSSATWYGDRGLFTGGNNSSFSRINNVEYITITSPGNATDFGDLSAVADYVMNTSNGTIGCSAGGVSTGTSRNTIDYFTFSTTGNATDFGDLTQARYAGSGGGDGSRGIFYTGQQNGPQNVIDYITFDTPGNATDFGDPTVASFSGGGANDATYTIYSCGGSGVYSNVTEYVTTQTPGNATDFGDGTVARQYTQGVCDTTYGCFGGGFSPSYLDTIDYITIASTGNSTDFGDLLQGTSHLSGTGPTNATYGVFGGGYIGSSTSLNTIQYITIATPGNATDFGDLGAERYGVTGMGGSPS